VPIFFKDLTNPRWSYAFAKTGGEVAIHSASTQFQLNHLILRLHNLYGPRMGYEHVIPDLIRKQSVNSGEILGFNQSRSFMYVEDAVRLIVNLSLNDEFQNQTYNLGSNQEIKIIDLAKEISNLTGFRGKFVDIGAPRGSVARRVPDTSKIDKALGVQNLTSLKVGLQKTFSHMKPELGLS
jgi:UDP-glucose 4-epimerase